MASDPDGFLRHELESDVCVLRADVADALMAAGVRNPESWRATATRVYGGRASTFGVSIAGVGDVCVRPYVHGGAMRHLTGDRYAGDGRFARELALLVEATAADVPVTQPLGYVSRRTTGVLRRGWLLTVEERAASDVLAYLESGPPPASRHATVRTAGRAVRRLHDAGIDHPDLHLANLLRLSDERVLVLDLDAATSGAPLTRERRLAGLFRLDRHAEKQRARGATVARTDRLRLLRAYAADDWPERAEVRRLAGELARHVSRHRRSRPA